MYLTSPDPASYHGLLEPSQVEGSRSVMEKPGSSCEGLNTSLVQNRSDLVQLSVRPEQWQTSDWEVGGSRQRPGRRVKMVNITRMSQGEQLTEIFSV